MLSEPLGGVVTAGLLSEAAVAVAVSVVGGLVVALLTAPETPLALRALRRRLQARRRRPPPKPEQGARPELSPPTRGAVPAASPPEDMPAPVIALLPPPPPHPAAIPLPLGPAPVEPEIGVPAEVLVRLLGRVRVDGVELRSKALGVLAFLATHRQASPEVLDDRCWAEPSASRGHKRVKEIMWECRRALGLAHLPPARAGTYTVGPGVSTDLALFDAHLAGAEGLEGAERAMALRTALELVDGPIFRYPARSAASFAWVDLENLANHWELRIEQTAIECAELFVACDNVRDAVVGLLRILEVLPLNVELTECLMRAHAAAGERHLVQSVFDAHVEGLTRVLDAEPEQTTVALRDELLSATERAHR